jgi:hypothetical protein
MLVSVLSVPHVHVDTRTHVRTHTMHIQGDQKVCVHLMITIHLTTWLSLTASPTVRAKGTPDSH